ncbi:hypothetical protein KVR01_011917 [Diaporthe batatas]|uniref:uncharacterized protein n=1 Tax=Diaporthe batatas TaxID=748121 RepID=UPI001D03EC6C|nr:uncharacterized protein KVR01_011917 [Diaporthe batatas]KAG8158156.1 hypothetical protein KVR01_011917 [Diaporthe batatas]
MLASVYTQHKTNYDCARTLTKTARTNQSDILKQKLAGYPKKKTNATILKQTPSTKSGKSSKRDFKEIHQCKSNHPGCKDVAIVSPSIQRLDGSYFRVSWAPCGLEFAREYIRNRAADPDIADLINNDRVAEPPRGRSRQAKPVPPERAHMSAGGGTDMMYDVGDPDDPYAGENIEMGPVPTAFPEDDMVYDLPVPPEAYRSRRRKKGKKANTVPGPFGRPVPAPGQGGMMYDDPDDPYGGEFAGVQGIYYMGEGMDYPGESSGMGHAATGAYGDNSHDSSTRSTAAPRSKPPRAKWVANRHENFYRGDEFEDGRFVDPFGVEVAQEERAPPRTSTSYTATTDNYDTILHYSMDYRTL